MADSEGYKIALITSMEALTDKLKAVELDIGADDKITVVTNAPNVGEGKRVVVATIGSTVGDIKIDKRSVGGRASEGMLCDNPALGWTGGGAGVAAIIPESDEYKIGDAPPSTRPRGNLPQDEAPKTVGGPVRGPGETSLFAKKLTKEEKKAAAAARKAARAAAKAKMADEAAE